MKVIFLDIDGVLNTFGDKELINNIFEKKKLERLIKLSNETHSKIIITSDRRIHIDERLQIDDAFDRYNCLIDYLSYFFIRFIRILFFNMFHNEFYLH